MSLVRARGGGRVRVSRRRLILQAPFIAVLGAMSFNMALCFVNTNLGGIGNAYVIGCEITIISAVLLYSLPMINQLRLFVLSAALLYLLGLVALRMAFSGDGVEIKPVRDLLIPIAFFLLGARSGDVRMADKIVAVAMVLVVAVGILEYAIPDAYTRLFNIANFYVERGTMAAGQAQQSSSLFVSGMRPAGASGGRNLLPFLGDHRVSSIFLEPVSAGNFGIIIFMWALVRSLATRTFYWGTFASALFIIVMSDSRFGAYFCIISLALALSPAIVRAATTAVLPVVGILILVVMPDILFQHFGINNGFIGRVIMSGQILGRFDTLNWFGLKTPDFYTFDSGYANVIGGIGIVGVILFWAIFLFIRGRGRQFAIFHSLAGAYFAALLCISNSPFTIKTGSLLWFLVGVLSCGGGERQAARRASAPVARFAPDPKWAAALTRAPPQT